MKKETNGFGISSLVLGILSIIFCWIPFAGLISGVLGLVFSNKQKIIFPNGIATAGLVTSIIGTVFSGLYMFFWLIVIIIIGSVV